MPAFVKAGARTADSHHASTTITEDGRAPDTHHADAGATGVGIEWAATFALDANAAGCSTTGVAFTALTENTNTAVAEFAGATITFHTCTAHENPVTNDTAAADAGNPCATRVAAEGGNRTCDFGILRSYLDRVSPDSRGGYRIIDNGGVRLGVATDG